MGEGEGLGEVAVVVGVEEGQFAVEDLLVDGAEFANEFDELVLLFGVGGVSCGGVDVAEGGDVEGGGG